MTEATEMSGGYFEISRPMRIWILVNGEEPPEGTVIIPTDYPYIHLAVQPMEGDANESKERSGPWDRTDTESGPYFPIDLRPGKPPRHH